MKTAIKYWKMLDTDEVLITQEFLEVGLSDNPIYVYDKFNRLVYNPDLKDFVEISFEKFESIIKNS